MPRSDFGLQCHGQNEATRTHAPGKKHPRQPGSFRCYLSALSTIRVFFLFFFISVDVIDDDETAVFVFV